MTDAHPAKHEPGGPCPACGEPGRPIVYGLPAPETFEAAGRGDVVLGGCCVTGDDPIWHCPACACRWGGPESRPTDSWPTSMI